VTQFTYLHALSYKREQSYKTCPFHLDYSKQILIFIHLSAQSKNTFNVCSEHKQKLGQMERKESEPALVYNECQFMYKNITSFPKKPDADLNGPEASTSVQN